MVRTRTTPSRRSAPKAQNGAAYSTYEELGATAANRLLSAISGRVISGEAAPLTDRAGMAEALGYSYGGKRNVWGALGYREKPSFQDYMRKFRRHAIAGRVVEMPCETTWHEVPMVSDDEDPKVDTKFDKALSALDNRLQIWSTLRKVDVISGIGHYGVLVLGVAGQRLSEPLGPGRLAWIQAYHEDHAQISGYVDEGDDERFGLPIGYNIKAVGGDRRATTINVHWSRTIHVAEDIIEGMTHGTPRLERVYNTLDDVEKLGAAAEGYWRNGVMALTLGVDAEHAHMLDEPTLTANREEAEAFVHGFKRVLGLRGVNAERIAPDLVDPRGVWAMLVQQISGATGIPARMLVGSERGELSSAQDERAWIDRMSERQTQYVTPQIVRPMMDLLTVLGEVPEADYEVVWPALGDVQAEARSLRAERNGRAVKSYADAELIGQPIISRSEFREMLDLDPDEDLTRLPTNDIAPSAKE